MKRHNPLPLTNPRPGPIIVRMAAYDKIRSGLAGLDLTLDSIRLGDNVVWQVGSVDDYRRVVAPFAERAIAAGAKAR